MLQQMRALFNSRRNQSQASEAPSVDIEDSSRCTRCGQPIQPGQLIIRDLSRVIHVACPTAGEVARKQRWAAARSFGSGRDH